MGVREAVERSLTRHQAVVCIPTYNRPVLLLDLLMDIDREVGDRNIHVIIYDDCSDVSYAIVDDFLKQARFTCDFHHGENRNGKKNYWLTVHMLWNMAARRMFDHLFMLQDDGRLCLRFFDRAIEEWCGIEDDRKLVMNIAPEKTKIGRRCWTKVPPTPVSFGYRNYFRLGWFDGWYMAEKQLLREMGFRVLRVKPVRWERMPHLSSGVGQQLSTRVVGKGRTIYAPFASLVELLQVPSEMNPEEGKRTPRASHNYVHSL